MNKITSILLILIGVLLLLLLGMGAFWYVYIRPIVTTWYAPPSWSNLPPPPPPTIPGAPILEQKIPTGTPKDNLNVGSIDEQGRKLYGDDGFGFEVRYPASFSTDRWVFIPDYKIGVSFKGELKEGGNVEFFVLASRLRDDIGMICGLACDAPNGKIVFGGQQTTWYQSVGGPVLPASDAAWIEWNNIYYGISIVNRGGVKSDLLHSLFKEFVESFHFVK